MFSSNFNGPFDTIEIDIIGPFPISAGGNRYIVIATDYFTKWAEARALSTKSAKSIAVFLFEEIFSRHGPPREIRSDRGKESF